MTLVSKKTFLGHCFCHSVLLILLLCFEIFLQSLLEGCQRELHELHKRLEVADDEVERERERWKTDRDEFERARKEMRSQIDELKDNLKQSTEKIEELEQKQKVQSKLTLYNKVPLVNVG